MEYASEKTVIPIKGIDSKYTIPKTTSDKTFEQTSVVSDSYYNLPENVRNYLISKQAEKAAETTSLKRPHEDNNPSGPIYSDSYAPDLCDASLPKELRSQFQPLYCKLCAVQLSSNVVAKLHYNSKNHDKKVRKYLVEHSLKTGEPLHKRANVAKKVNVADDSSDPRYFHCYICDLPLTGKLHAESHYMGKNHHKAIQGKAPAGKGFYNANGQWIRTQHIQTDLDRDNFGLSFVDPSLPKEGPSLTSQKFSCEICNVNVTSQSQLDMHMAGQKHKKKVNSISLSVEPSKDNKTTSDPNDVGYSKYKTPSGLYYCKHCNLSLNSEVQFKQHLGSRKHLKKSAGQE